MSSGKGRAQVTYSPLRKPGEIRQENKVEHEEKPPVEAAVVPKENEAIERKDEQDISSNIQQLDLNKTEKPAKKYDDVLLNAVNIPEFIPRSLQGAAAVNAGPSFSLSASVHAREFVPGKPFITHEKTPAERIEAIKTFVSTKIKQVQNDPGLMDEISASMENYLSSSIKVEDDLRVISDILFEKCVSEPNFQYIGAKIANYLDKTLTTEGLSTNFRSVFLNRCKEENNNVSEMILNNPERVPNVAMFLGELLMSYKTKEGDPIDKFRGVVSNTIKSLLASTNHKLHICAGKLLKLTGSALDENQEELFETVKNMAADCNIDRTAQILFNRVCELRTMNWGRNETQQAPVGATLPGTTLPGTMLPGTTFPGTTLPGTTLPGASLYIPDMNFYLEQRNDEHPVHKEEEWNEFFIDGEDVDSSVDDTEQLYRDMFYEQYGGYVQYATADEIGNDDYDADYENFLSSRR